MQTLYIDVYFLINTTVNILAFYFSSLTAKIPTTMKRTAISGAIGGIYAVIGVFLYKNRLITFLLSATTLVLMCEIVAHGVSLFRKIKLAVFFLVFEMMIGGAVHYAYELLDTYVYNSISGIEEGARSRNLLLLALIVLVVMGALRSVIGIFSSSTGAEKIDLEIVFFGKISRIDAMIDSGNMAKDPMDSAPVMLIKEEDARKIFPKEIFFDEVDKIPDCYKGRIRLIPIALGGFSGIMRGVKADEVRIFDKKGSKIRVTIAIDKEGGTYGGYTALMPSAALDNVI